MLAVSVTSSTGRLEKCVDVGRRCDGLRGRNEMRGFKFVDRPICPVCHDVLNVSEETASAALKPSRQTVRCGRCGRRVHPVMMRINV